MKTISSREKALQEQLEGYVFDDERVLRSVPFAQFVTKQDELGVGLLLPKDREDNKGNITQIWQAVVITSARTFHPIFNGENRALGVTFEAIPGMMPRRYSLVLIPQFLHGSKKAKTARELYEQIKKSYEENLYFTKPWYAVHAVWDMATYFFGLFPAFPYLELRGVKAAGKSKVMTLSSCLTFNASAILTSPSESSLFRLVQDQRPTLYIDEAENLFRVVKGKVEHDGRVEVINSGYTSEGNVSRSEKRGNNWVVEYYRVYCPKMLASINGLYGATESRAIVHIMTRAPDNDKRGEQEIDRQEPRWQELRDELLLFTLENWKEVRKAYQELGKENIAGLKKRDFQLWRPLLTIARLIGSDVEKEILAVAAHQQALSRAEEISEGSWEYLLLERAYVLLKGGQRILYLADLVEAIPEEQRPHNNKSLSRILDRLGFRDFARQRNPTTRRIGYVIPSVQEFEQILGTLNPSFFPSFPSDSSDSRREEIIEESIESKESRRKEDNFEGKPPKETKEPEGTQKSVPSTNSRVTASIPSEFEWPEGKKEKNRFERETPLSAFLRTAENGKVYPLEAVAELCGITPDQAAGELAKAAKLGDCFQPKPSYWGVLR